VSLVAQRVEHAEDRFNRRHDVPCTAEELKPSRCKARQIGELPLAPGIGGRVPCAVARGAHQRDLVFGDAFHSQGVLLKLEQLVAKRHEPIGG
jgi:hypothetical protein